MTGQRLLAVFVALVAATAVVLVAWLIWFRPARTVVREQPVVTTPVVSSPSTPLGQKHDSGPKVKRHGRSRRSRSEAGNISGNNRAASRQPAEPNKRRSHPRRRTPPRTRPRPRKPDNGPSPPPPVGDQNQPPQRPPVDLTVPAPVTVCVRPTGGVNCP